MNINSITSPAVIPQKTPTCFGGSRLASFSRLLLTTSCVSLVSFAAVPHAFAAAPNGNYEFTTASGSVKFDGKKINVSQRLIKKLAGVSNEEIMIENSTLKIRRKALISVVNNFADDFDIDVETKVTGPTSVTLSKSGNTYTGKTPRPIVASFDGSILGEDFSGELKTRVAATVRGRTLTVVITFDGDAIGSDFSGKLTVVGKR